MSEGSLVLITQIAERPQSIDRLWIILPLKVDLSRMSFRPSDDGCSKTRHIRGSRGVEVLTLEGRSAEVVQGGLWVDLKGPHRVSIAGRQDQLQTRGGLKDSDVLTNTRKVMLSRCASSAQERHEAATI